MINLTYIEQCDAVLEEVYGTSLKEETCELKHWVAKYGPGVNTTPGMAVEAYAKEKNLVKIHPPL